MLRVLAAVAYLTLFPELSANKTWRTGGGGEKQNALA